jgi:NAD(P) transhydrogenase subunit alpha
MKIAIPKETREFETRVAASPETVKKFTALGAVMVVQAGAGDGANIPDAAYEAAGAAIAKNFAAAVKGADVILKIQRPTEAELKSMAKGQKLFCIMSPYNEPAIMEGCAASGVDAFAMEFMPRITRAQSMDVLSSQANLAGYKAVLEAANTYGRAFPQMMTPAGTVAPAKVFIMGVGVAGLQAIATARRLGAIVTATDVRPATEEQVASLRQERGIRTGPDLGRLCQGDVGRLQAPAGGTGRGPHRQAGYRHNHCPDPRSQGAGAGQRRYGRLDETGFGARRSGGRAGRQC